MIMISAKMNEIYPPKISSLISRCQRPISKEEIICTEGFIIDILNYDVGFNETAYHYISRLLVEDREKLEESEKLLSVIISEREISKLG